MLLPFAVYYKNGLPLNEYLNRKIERLIEQALSMNSFEIQSFKEQTKFTQTLFEDIPMITINILMLSNYLSVPKVSQNLFTEFTLL